jgi:hypothetical protein
VPLVCAARRREHGAHPLPEPIMSIQQPPLSVVIVEIVNHTPHWVWLVLAVITLLGLAQLRDLRVSRARLAVAPIALGVYSFWGATSALGALAAPAWLAGLALALAANRWLQWPRTVAVSDDGRLVLPGSVGPLLLMWAVFGLRYAVAVQLALHPALRHEAGFAIGVALLYGALSGLFAARALRVLHSARIPALVAAT